VSVKLPFIHIKTKTVQLCIAAKSSPFFMSESNRNRTQGIFYKIPQIQGQEVIPLALERPPRLTQLRIGLHPA